MITRSSQCRTVVDLARLRAEMTPDRPAYTYLTDGEAQGRILTWHDVDARARSLAASLGRLSGRNERMVLFFPTGLEFVTALFGCLYAGTVAVPAYPLDPLHLERTRARLRLMLEDCRPARILTTTEYRTAVLSMFDDRAHLERFEWGLVDTVPDLASAWRPREIDGNTLAIIQYTSGAIANPKGVLISHRNVLANEAMIADAHGYDIETTFVSWLPLAHDWGLINSILQPAYSGGRSVLMSPEAFLEKPVRWLRAISGCRAASSGGPNFAYDFCCRRIAAEERVGLDLAGWHWAGVSAGPVSSETLAAFSSAFQPFGFSASAFYSGYGLAEATVLVSDSERFQVPRVLIVDRASLQKGLVVPRVAADPSTTQSFTSCGTPPAVERVRIVDPETRIARQDDQIGEIWVAGDNVAGGYWNRPEESQQTFGGITADGEGPFLRTGDLGFFHHGELYICGRLKDLIIIRGRNIYPQDIELTVEHSHRSVRPGSSVAFAIDAGGEERVVVLQELRPVAPGSRRPDAEIADAIRNAIVRVHGLFAEVVLVEPGTIRKTSSGKLQRNACREAFIAGELGVRHDKTSPAGIVYREPPPLTASGKADGGTLAQIDPKTADPRRSVESPQDDVERTVARIFDELLKLESVGRSDDFFLLGGDSLLAFELQIRLSETFGVHVGNFHDGATVARIAAEIRRTVAESTARSCPIPVLIPLLRSGGETPLFIVPGWPGQAFVSPHFLELLGDNQPVWAFQARGLDGLREPHTTVEDMAAEYLGELRTQRPHGPYFLAAVCSGVYIATVMARSLREAGETVLPLLLLDPPNSVLRRESSRLTEKQFVRNMRARTARGATAGPVDDPAYMKALLRTATAFEHATANHQPLAYDGPVYVLSSYQRKHGADALALRQVFTGRFKRYEVGSTHLEAFDPRNPIFASSLLHCVGLIREAARAG